MTKLTIKAIVCRVAEAPRVEELEDSLEAWQKFVDGYIETVRLDNGVLVICNEEGRLRPLPFNGFVLGVAGVHQLFGNFALVRSAGSEFASVTDRDAAVWLPELLRRLAPG